MHIVTFYSVLEMTLPRRYQLFFDSLQQVRKGSPNILHLQYKFSTVFLLLCTLSARDRGAAQNPASDLELMFGVHRFYQGR